MTEPARRQAARAAVHTSGQRARASMAVHRPQKVVAAGGADPQTMLQDRGVLAWLSKVDQVLELWERYFTKIHGDRLRYEDATTSRV